MSIQAYFRRQSAKVDRALRGYLPKANMRPSRLHRAMRYAALSDGKRIRPIFALAACEAVGGDARKILPAACALELIHTYSLIHDDLPCMDNDAVRRGRPSCHVKFGEDTALLAGDALLTLAFQIIASSSVRATRRVAPTRALQVVSWVAEAIGSRGMVGGQVVDMEYQGRKADISTIRYINAHKTGALIAVSARVGAALGGGTSRQVAALHRCGKAAGLLFQIVDDILDEEGYAKVHGLSKSRTKAALWAARAKRELSIFAERGRALRGIVDFLLNRTS